MVLARLQPMGERDGDEKDEGLCGAPDEPIRRQRQMVGHLEEIESLPSEQQLL
jgi:hypothetical protein